MGEEPQDNKGSAGADSRLSASTPPNPDPAARQPLSYDNKTLNIYCPSELAREFIDFANREYAGKQYIALKELLRAWRESRQLVNIVVDMRALQEEVDKLRAEVDVLNDGNGAKEPTIPTAGGGLPGS